MALHFVGSSKLEMHLENVPGIRGDRFSVSLFVRVNQPAPDFVVGGLVRWNYQGVWYSLTPAGLVNYSLTFMPNPNNGTNGWPTNSAYRAPGNLTHLVFTFDRDDLSQQAIYLNGVKTLLQNGTPGVGAVNNVKMTMGNQDGPGGDVEVQDLLFIDGYVLTSEDLEAMTQDPRSSSDILGRVPGAVGVYHSLDGPIGASPAEGDPGITADDPNLSFGAPSGPGTVTYSPRLSFVPERGVVDMVRVNSSGKSIAVGFRSNLTQKTAQVKHAALVSPPSIRIDGGEPIRLRSDAQVVSRHMPDAALLFLPEGRHVPPGATVTISAPAMWIDTTAGNTPALVDYPVDNRSGMRNVGPPGPDPDPLRNGINMGQPHQLPWSTGMVTRNRTKDLIAFEMELREDGTPAQNFVTPVCQHASFRNTGKVGPLFKLGVAFVGWDDQDHEVNPSTVTLSPSLPHKVRELEDYRNNGDAQGRGQVRAFLIERNSMSSTLAAAIDADDTTIDLVGPLGESIFSMLAGQTEYYLEVGDEQIRVPPIDHPNHRSLAGCERGWNGTAAAPHPAGAPVTLRFSAQWGQMDVRAFGYNGRPVHLKNLKIYMPGEFDLPETVGPMTLPEDGWDHYNRDFLEDSADRGFTGLRCMDTTPTFFYCSEIEHTADKDEMFWNRTRWVDRFVFKSVRKYDRATSPYVYFNTPGVNRHTYPVSVGAIATAPAQGTRETITIVDGRSAPVLYGQVLFLGDERVRVVGLAPPGSDEYVVVRGCEGTAPAPHPAGTYQLGWRTLIASDAQYQLHLDSTVRQGHQYAEVTLDEERSTPLRAGWHLMFKGYAPPNKPPSTRGNPHADHRLTLTRPIGVGDLKFHAEVEDEAEWASIAPGMWVRFADADASPNDPGGDDEMYQLGFVLPGPGRQGVFAIVDQPTGAGFGFKANYAVGVTATTESEGILYSNPDGTGKCYNTPFTYYSVIHPTGLNSFLIQPASDIHLTTRAGYGLHRLIFPNGIEPGATVIDAVADEPGMWDSIAPGMNLVAGPYGWSTEFHPITAVDRQAGRITVGIPFTNSFPSGTEGTTGVHAAHHVAFPQEFTPDAVKTEDHYLPKAPGTFPFEFGPRLAAKFDKTCWYWVNAPYMASNDMMYEIAKRTRDNLPSRPGLKVQVELSNEIWNWGFSQRYPPPGLTRLSGDVDPMHWIDHFVVRAHDFYRIVRDCFEEHGRGHEVEWVMAYQGANPWPATRSCARLGLYPHAVAGAPYFVCPRSGEAAEEYVSVLNAIDDDAACDLVSHLFEFYTARWDNDVKSMHYARDEYVALTGQPLKIYFYEGNPEEIIPYHMGADQAQDRTRDILYNPNWYWVERAMYYLYRHKAECDYFAVFAMAFPYSDPAPYLWGLRSKTWGGRSGYGDGRPGSFDNRSKLFRRGLPNSVGPLDSPDLTNDIVRMQAWKDEQDDFWAAQESASTPPEVVSPTIPAAGDRVIVTFSESMAVAPGASLLDLFSLKVDGSPAPLAEASLAGAVVTLVPEAPILAGSVVTFSLDPGDGGLADLAGTPPAGFADRAVNNGSTRAPEPPGVGTNGRAKKFVARSNSWEPRRPARPPAPRPCR